MIEGRKHFRFALEARHALGVMSKLFRQELQRHVAAKAGIGRTVNFAHSAHADFGLDMIMRDGLSDHSEPLQAMLCRSALHVNYPKLAMEDSRRYVNMLLMGGGGGFGEQVSEPVVARAIRVLRVCIQPILDLRLDPHCLFR